jgi:hypothetical protein
MAKSVLGNFEELGFVENELLGSYVDKLGSSNDNVLWFTAGK